MFKAHRRRHIIISLINPIIIQRIIRLTAFTRQCRFHSAGAGAEAVTIMEVITAGGTAEDTVAGMAAAGITKKLTTDKNQSLLRSRNPASFHRGRVERHSRIKPAIIFDI